MNITSVVRAIENFPTLPTIYSALLELLSDIDTKISDIVNLISKDQATVLKILKTVFYRHRQRRRVVVLGDCGGNERCGGGGGGDGKRKAQSAAVAVGGGGGGGR